jgi:hypothetical protein
MESAVFADMLSFPQAPAEENEGLSDNKPILLPGASSFEFDQLLWIMHAR